MAKTNWQDPKTSEIQSSHISGLQEATGKLEESIGLESVAETGIPLTEVFISNDDRYRVFQAPEGKRNWLLSPAPVIYQNGVVMTGGFTIDYGGGALILNTNGTSANIFTADATYTKKDATSIKEKIGDIATLITTNKADLVSAINEVKEQNNNSIYLQADEPVNPNSKTLWFAVGNTVNFNDGGVMIENAQTSTTPPETFYWFEPI